MSEQVMLQATWKTFHLGSASGLDLFLRRLPLLRPASDFGSRLIADAGFSHGPIARTGSELFGRQNNRRIHAAEQGHSLSSASWITRSTAPAFNTGADDGKKCFAPIAGVPKTTKRTAYHPRPIAALISPNASGQYLAAIVRSS